MSCGISAGERQMGDRRGEGEYNVIVIGAGTAGLVTAAGTAGLGGRVALIERNEMGGDCLNFGCVPSKALISSGRMVHNIRTAQRWGLRAAEPDFAFEDVFARMRERRAKIAPNDSEERFEGLGVDVFRGDARFLSPTEVQVRGTVLRGRHIVIATGRRAGIPPIQGIDDVLVYTNETFFDKLEKKPRDLVVIGGGPIGCELGQTMNRLGVRTTIVEFLPQIMAKEDPEVAAYVQHRLEEEGVRVLTGTAGKKIGSSNDRIVLEGVRRSPSGSEEVVEVEAEAVLVAAGRIPNVESLDLEAAGVRYSKQGIEVNAYMQTSQRHIYAAGDIAGPYQFTHMADVQARAVVRNVLMPVQMARQKVDYSVVPWCTYTSPEVARVGLSETEATDRGIEYDLYEESLGELDRAIVESEEEGFIRVLTKAGNGEILGVTLVGAHAGDLLHEFVLAMKHGLGLSAIASTVHAYPTFAELARKVGDRYNRTRLTPRAKSIFSWLYRRRRAA